MGKPPKLSDYIVASLILISILYAAYVTGRATVALMQRIAEVYC